MSKIIFDYHFYFINHKIKDEQIISCKNDVEFYKRVFDKYGIMANEIDIIMKVPIINTNK